VARRLWQRRSRGTSAPSTRSADSPRHDIRPRVGVHEHTTAGVRDVSIRLLCGQRHEPEWSQCPHNSAVTAPPGAATSMSGVSSSHASTVIATRSTMTGECPVAILDVTRLLQNRSHGDGCARSAGGGVGGAVWSCQRVERVDRPRRRRGDGRRWLARPGVAFAGPLGRLEDGDVDRPRPAPHAPGGAARGAAGGIRRVRSRGVVDRSGRPDRRTCPRLRRRPGVRVRPLGDRHPTASGGTRLPVPARPPATRETAHTARCVVVLVTG
jgi:hypothetical protein